MIARLFRAYYVIAGWASWFVFASVGLTLNVLCLPFFLVPHGGRIGHIARKAILKLFGAWCAWLHAARLIFVTWHGFHAERLRGPAVYIANHPSLTDATFLLARLPDTICIFKPSLTRNPAIGPAAIMAEYVSGDSGLDLIRDVAEKLKAGRSVLIFPEGTRTAPGRELNALKPGFALIALRGQVPVRLITIRSPRTLMPKGHPPWKIPPFPAEVEITLAGEITPRPGENSVELTARVSEQLLKALSAP